MKFDSIVILGNSEFGGLYHREHGLAVELARRGYDVFFVEEMPSLASRLRRRLSHRGTPQSKTQPGDLVPSLPNLHILTPPVVPTFFRSSYVPAFDQVLFRRWFRGVFRDFDWKHSVLIVTLPYWWGGFADRHICPARIVVYDWHDSLEVPSRNAVTLRRMQRAEHRLLREADLVTCSARTMIATLEDKSRRTNIHFLPNAVRPDLPSLPVTKPSERTRKVLGYLGSLDRRWIDAELLLKTALRFNTCDLEMIGPVDDRFRRLFRPTTNVLFDGLVDHRTTFHLLQNFDVLLIPLKQNPITDVVNPLKLYEYCATGHPIVATKTKELEQYARYVYLAESREHFLSLVGAAIQEDDGKRRADRIEFARNNTWSTRVDQLVSLIETS